MLDFRNTQIRVGDIIVYPGRQGSGLWMTEAEVLELVPENIEARKKAHLVVQPRRVGLHGRLPLPKTRVYCVERTVVVS